MANMDRINADYIYCLLNGRRMTLSELSSFSRLDTLALTKALSLLRLDTLALTKALSLLRLENELAEYTEDGREYLELKNGYVI